MKNKSIAIIGIIAILAVIGAGLWFNFRDATPAAIPIVPATPIADNGQPLEPVLWLRSDAFIAKQAAVRGGAEISEAYLMEHIHASWARDLVTIFDDLLYSCGIESVSTHTWPNDNIVRIKGKQRGDWTIHFTKVHYDPELTNIKYGDTAVSQEIPTELTGHSYLFDLTHHDEGANFKQTDSVTLEQHRETSMTNSTDMNYSVQSETKIGGEYLGVSMEETLTVAFGQAFHSEKTQAEGESKAKTEEHEFDIPLEPLKATLVVLDAVEVHSSTPFAVNGVADWQVTIHIPGHPCSPYPIASSASDRGQYGYSKHYLNWYARGPGFLNNNNNLDWCHGDPKVTRSKDETDAIAEGGCTLTFGKDGSAVEEIDQLLSGVHVRWPGMGFEWKGHHYGWIQSAYPHHSTIHAYYQLIGTESRRVQLTGTQRRVYEDSIKETITDVTGEDLDAVEEQHGAVETQVGG